MTMQALHWSLERGTVELVTVAVPSSPEDGEVVVKVGYAGVCGTDLHIIKKEFASAPEVILGHEFGGMITAVGPGVTSLAVGDKVAVNPNLSCGSCRFCVRGQVNFCTTPGERKAYGVLQDGGFAEFCKVPVAVVAKMPAGVSGRMAVMCEPYSCILNGFKKFGDISNDAQILVTGAGIIGLLWCSLFHYHGYRDVTISEMSEERKRVAEKLGFGFKTCGPADLDKRFSSSKAEEEGFDIIVDCTGSPRAVQHAFNFLRRGGKLNVFGCCPKTSEMKINPAEIMLKELTIFGTLINPFTFPAATSLVNNMAQKYLSYERLGIQEFKLAEYKEALDVLQSGKIAKAVFAIDDTQ